MNPQNLPMLTIAIPLHNRTDLVHELLSTVPDRSDIEVIIVDDHSTAPTEISHVFENAGLRLLRAPIGQRYAGSARNQAIDEAKGNFLFFADSDDRLVTDEFEAIVDELDSFDGDVLHGHLTSFVDGTDEVGTRHRAPNWLLEKAQRTGDNDALFRQHGPCGKFIRRSFCLRNDIRFGNTQVSNDVLFNLKLNAAIPRIQIRPQIVYAVRQGHGSLISMRSLCAIETRLEVQFEYNAGLRALGKAHLLSSPWIYIKWAAGIDLGTALTLLIRAWKNKSPLIPTAWSIRNTVGRTLWIATSSASQ